MSKCDVCNMTTSFRKGTVYTVAEFRQIVSEGFGPSDETLEDLVMKRWGVQEMGCDEASKYAILLHWKGETVALSGTDWLLCPSCASRASQYMHKMPGQGKRSKTGNVTGNCFIATATMGDYDHPAVLTLREFRDEFLEKRKWGRAFTRLYYKHAPLFAEIIEKSSILRKLSYVFIVMPLVALSEGILNINDQ